MAIRNYRLNKVMDPFPVWLLLNKILLNGAQATLSDAANFSLSKCVYDASKNGEIAVRHSSTELGFPRTVSRNDICFIVARIRDFQWSGKPFSNPSPMPCSKYAWEFRATS